MPAMNPRTRRLAILAIVVGVALLAERTLTLASADADVAQAPARPRPVSAPRAPGGDPVGGPQSTGVQLERLEARQAMLEEGSERSDLSARPDLFGRVSWAPPPAPVPRAPVAPPPAPPAFAYAYLGGLLDDGVRTAFFNKGERVLAIKAGDTVDSVYRVDAMTDTKMQLTYLPLNQSLTVPLGGGQ